MEGPKSNTHFMESMWRDLPAGLLERVFTFLPIASLCRFRTLSKDWNGFISSPSFKHAGAASDEDYALITPTDAVVFFTANSVDEIGIESGWVVLDVPRMRYFTLSDAFLTEYLQRLVTVYWPFLLSLQASDGGLLCMWYDINSITSPIFVCNPVLKTMKQLPHPKEALSSMYLENLVTTTDIRIVMATNRRSMEYEIIVIMYTAGRHLETGKPFPLECILVYESKTGTWRTAPTSQPLIGHQIWWGSLTIFDTNLFCVIPVDAPVVSLDIYEVDVVKGASTRVTGMPRALFTWVLGHDLGCSLFNAESKIKAVTACADWILVATVVGRCAAYSLSGNSWHQFPDDSTILTAFRKGYEGAITTISS